MQVFLHHLKLTILAGIVTAAVAAGQNPKAEDKAAPKASPGAKASPGTPDRTQAAKFVQAAIEAGYNEIAMGQLALNRSSSEDVKELAEDLIDGHGKINEDFTDLAEERGIELPAFHDEESKAKAKAPGQAKAQAQAKAPEQAKAAPVGEAERLADSKAAELAALRGAAFDRLYVSILVDAHEKSLRDYETFIRTTQDEELKDFAEDTLAKLREHLEDARSLHTRLSGNKAK